MTAVPGDPASLSACAGTVRRVGAELVAGADGIRVSGDALAEEWRSRASVRVRQRVAALAAATDTTAEQVRHVGGVLQDHATELADLVARARRIGEEADAAGLEVIDRRVILAYGVTGTADPDRAREQEASRERLQHDLDLVLAQHRRRRDWMLGALRDSATVLAQVSRGMRQG